MSTSPKFCLKSIISEKTQIQYKRKKKNLFVAKAIEAKAWLLLQVKLQDGFTVLLMTETKFGTILTLENNTNPFELLGNCRSCR